jgi:succinate dehydrogenase/fumarate reductase-like Fe-S protein
MCVCVEGVLSGLVELADSPDSKQFLRHVQYLHEVPSCIMCGVCLQPCKQGSYHPLGCMPFVCHTVHSHCDVTDTECLWRGDPSVLDNK